MLAFYADDMNGSHGRVMNIIDALIATAALITVITIVVIIKITVILQLFDDLVLHILGREFQGNGCNSGGTNNGQNVLLHKFLL